MTKRNSDFTLPSYDDIFTTQEMRDDAKLEKVQNIPLAELHPFKDHPFKILDNEEMERMIESIRKVGAITPALARPMPDGGYELISGHRRLAACQVLGLETMPVIVREMSDDEAVIAMVDANLQRETILPSEKAFAYKMKLDALNHQGVTSRQVGEKLHPDDLTHQASSCKRKLFRWAKSFLSVGWHPPLQSPLHLRTSHERSRASFPNPTPDTPQVVCVLRSIHSRPQAAVWQAPV